MHERLPCVPVEPPRRSRPSRLARRSPLLMALAVLVSAQLSCGSSSKSDSRTTPQGSSNWDQLVWEQDVWS